MAISVVPVKCLVCGFHHVGLRYAQPNLPNTELLLEREHLFETAQEDLKSYIEVFLKPSFRSKIKAWSGIKLQAYTRYGEDLMLLHNAEIGPEGRL